MKVRPGPPKLFSGNGVSVAAMCAESHQYRPLLATEGGGLSKPPKLPILCPYCLLPACSKGVYNPNKKTPQACKCLQGFIFLKWSQAESNRRPPACKECSKVPDFGDFRAEYGFLARSCPVRRRSITVLNRFAGCNRDAIALEPCQLKFVLSHTHRPRDTSPIPGEPEPRRLLRYQNQWA